MLSAEDKPLTAELGELILKVLKEKGICNKKGESGRSFSVVRVTNRVYEKEIEAGGVVILGVNNGRSLFNLIVRFVNVIEVVDKSSSSSGGSGDEDKDRCDGGVVKDN